MGQAPSRRAAVGEVAEARVADRADEVLGRDVVLVDDDEDLVRVGDEEVVDVVEHRPSGVAPSSQNVWQRYMPRSPSPRKPSRSRMRSAASTASGLDAVVLGLPRASSGLPKSVRRRPLRSRSA